MNDELTPVVETTPDLKSVVAKVLDAVEKEREKEIIARRFGLNASKETLEQIGELLGITRERVRQLEKAILIRLKIAAESGQLDLERAEKFIIKELHEMGRAARLTDLALKINPEATETDKAHLAFISTLSPRLTVLEENDHYHHGVGIAEHFDDKNFKKGVDQVVKTVKEYGQAIKLTDLHDKLDFDHPDHVKAVASLSKQLANLKDDWGLTKWPAVNPKNIRDKIYVILQEKGKPMHFSDIARAIKNSDFKRKDVTTQAIHNELIKDKRFVLVGRGIYALKEWGFKQGTVADVIRSVLRKNGAPMHRDEIVRAVLKERQVKETTILLNLQSKPEFKRVAKATYDLAG